MWHAEDGNKEHHQLLVHLDNFYNLNHHHKYHIQLHHQVATLNVNGYSFKNKGNNANKKNKNGTNKHKTDKPGHNEEK